MAERPLITPFSMLSFSLVLLVLFTIGICWFFSWNPANFLSDQLRSFGKKTSIEQKTESGTSPSSPTSINEETKPIPPESEGHGQADAGQNPASLSTSKYTLHAEFQEPTKATVTVDEEFPAELTFSAGQTQDWYAKSSIILALPLHTKTRLTMNGVLIPLPEPANGYITVSIPGSSHR